MKARTKHWLDSSEYDLKVARNLLKTQSNVYVVFICHLAIEKLLKALVVEVTDLNEPPHIHSLNRLTELAKIVDDLSNDQKEFLSELTRMQSATRYADELHTYRSFTRKVAEEYLSKTKAMHKWFKKKLMSATSSANS
jgi:HEPN domain-containing protein